MQFTTYTFALYTFRQEQKMPDPPPSLSETQTADSPADDARNSATYRLNPVSKKQGCKLESLQAAMGELLGSSTARKANRRVQSGIIS